MIDYKNELKKQKEELKIKTEEYKKMFDKLTYQQHNQKLMEIVTIRSNIKTMEKKLKKRSVDFNE